MVVGVSEEHSVSTRKTMKATTHISSSIVAALLLGATASAKLAWNSTQFLFTFGDSYTTDGFNISAGVDSPNPGFVSILLDHHIEELTC